MKNILLPALAFIFYLPVNGNFRDSTVNYNLPDSVRAIQFLAEIRVQSPGEKKGFVTGIKTDAASITLNYGRQREICFTVHTAKLNDITRGSNIGFDRKDWEMIFSYEWQFNETYKLMISQATDSASNFSLYSGYIFLPKENKWKWIGTAKIEGRWNTIQQPAFFYKNWKKQNMTASTGQVWCQRSNGSWKNMSVRTPSEKEGNLSSPVVNLFGHVDSIQQRQTDIKLIQDGIAAGKTDAKNNEQGVYYTIIKEGTGKQVSVNDTVVAYYKGYLFEDGQVFDQTKDKPATFPLNRLIKGWQIGVPLCKVGGKIKLVIPSDLAYSIRTRAAKIPPNSILVFEIEVVDVKPPQ